MPGVKSEITKEENDKWGEQMEGKRGKVDEEGHQQEREEGQETFL